MKRVEALQALRKAGNDAIHASRKPLADPVLLAAAMKRAAAGVLKELGKEPK